MINYENLTLEDVLNFDDDELYQIQNESKIIKNIPQNASKNEMIKYLDQNNGKEIIKDLCKEMNKTGYIPISSEGMLKQSFDEMSKIHPYKYLANNTGDFYKERNQLAKGKHAVPFTGIKYGELGLRNNILAGNGYMLILAAIGVATGVFGLGSIPIMFGFNAASCSTVGHTTKEKIQNAATSVIQNPISKFLQRVVQGTVCFNYSGIQCVMITNKGILNILKKIPQSKAENTYIYALFYNKQKAMVKPVIIARENFGKLLYHKLWF